MKFFFFIRFYNFSKNGGAHFFKVLQVSNLIETELLHQLFYKIVYQRFFNIAISKLFNFYFIQLYLFNFGFSENGNKKSTLLKIR